MCLGWLQTSIPTMRLSDGWSGRFLGGGLVGRQAQDWLDVPLAYQTDGQHFVLRVGLKRLCGCQPCRLVGWWNGREIKR